MIRRRAGLYVTLDGQHAIIRTDTHEGPRGGTLRLWELASPGRNGSWELTGILPHPTLREARAELERQIGGRA